MIHAFNIAFLVRKPAGRLWIFWGIFEMEIWKLCTFYFQQKRFLLYWILSPLPPHITKQRHQVF